MLANSPILDFKGESMVTELVRDAVKTAINNKYNVLIDETNVNSKFLESSIDYYNTLADVEFQIFDISIEKAIERDNKRERAVGKEVIEKMYKNYKNLLDSGIDIYSTRKKKARIETNLEFNSFEIRPNAVVFDVDGTVSHANGRRGYFDWNKVDRDLVDEKVRETFKAYKNAGYKMIIVTGRDGECEELTKKWLIDNGFEFDDFYCRPIQDFRKDTVVKTEIYNEYLKPKYNVLAVYEDRAKVVDMWRGLGIKCYQVIDGSY